jgi:hypothetical protein
LKLFYICLFIALPSVIFAQSNYHQGYVVKNSGDTVKGYIDYREWSQSPTSIDFRTSKDDRQTQQFDPATIRAFGIIGMETYISYNGLISRDRNHFPNLADDLDTTKKQAAIFLRQNAAGRHLSLYSQTDHQKTRYFVAEANATPVELQYNQYYNEQHDAIERTIFRGQLIFYINKYTPGNTSLISQAEELAFEDSPLEDIVYKINGDAAVKAKGLPKQSKSRWFVGTGLSYGQNKDVAVTSTSHSELPQVSIGFDMFDNPNVQQLIFRTSLSISYVNAKVTYTLPESLNGILTFDQITTAITPQIIYNVYNSDNFKVYIGGGASLNFSAYSNTDFSGIGPNGTNSSSFNFSAFWVSMPLQTGIMVNKKWEASFTYAPYTKITPNSYNRFNSESFGLGVKFFLGRH